MSKTKVLVVDDSAFMRLLISDILSEDPGLEVGGSAVNGKQAVEKVKEVRPDIVLLDMNMADYDGLYAVRRIMTEHPVPILILSAQGNTDLQPIFEALELGAVDYMNKPNKGNAKMRDMNRELIQKIKSVSRAEPRKIQTPLSDLRNLEHHFDGENNYDIVAIGASTGGPTAIEHVITALPANLNVPVIICQHMPSNFIQPFVSRLNTLSPLNVVMGRKGMVPNAGMIIVAPGDTNMVLEKNPISDRVQIGFCDEVFKEYNNPSINAMMLSVAKCYGKRSIGVILTGMGKDGVKGLKAIKDAGGSTIAQDEKSSVIYGMPKAAVETGAAQCSIHVKEIGSFIVNSL